MEQESIAGTVVDEITTTGRRKNSKGDKSDIILCPKCLANGIRKECRGQIGLETHDDWNHNPKKKAIRMAAAARVGRERELRNRGMLAPVRPKMGRPKMGRPKKNAPPSGTREYKNAWYKKNKAKVTAARKRRASHEVTMELASPNGTLQRAAKTEPEVMGLPRLFQFLKEAAVVEQALAYVQNR